MNITHASLAYLVRFNEAIIYCQPTKVQVYPISQLTEVLLFSTRWAMTLSRHSCCEFNYGQFVSAIDRLGTSEEKSAFKCNTNHKFKKYF